MFGLTVLDLSTYIGLAAVGFATVNVCIGLLIWGRYSPWREWPHRRFDIFRIHRWSGYLTLTTSLLHPIPLLFSQAPPFRIVDILLPLWSPKQPIENTIGAAALYLLVLIVVTSIYRVALGRPLWKKFHYLTYAAAAGLLIHALLTDPDLKTGEIDYFDGGKLFVEFCCVVFMIGASLRMRRWLHKRKGARAALAEVPEAEG
jgi:sulfoxide reductase heme-binding subunit YedZ